MSQIVIDCSVTMAWCFPDEADAYSTAALELLNTQTAIVPAHWPLEVANVLVINERRGRITAQDATDFIRQLEELPIEIDADTAERAFDEVLGLARRCRLTIYDAAYLDLSMRTGASLCTLDRQLMSAADEVGAAVFQLTE